MMHRLVNEFKIAAEMGRMRVSYREAITSSLKLRHVHQTPAGARTIPTGTLTVHNNMM